MTGSSPRSFEDILSRLTGARQSGDSWTAPCPGQGHKTPAGHLTLKDAGDKALVTCQGGRHSYADICQALGFASLSYSGNGIGGGTTIGQGRNRATAPANQAQTAVAASDATGATQQLQGVTLAELAEGKRLPTDFLKSLGLTDFKYMGRPAVRIPYVNETGEVCAIRFRLSMSGKRRFAWRRGDKVLPYGLDRLELARRLGWITVVEGESDCWTLWFYGLPAFGIPGKGIFPEAWGGYLEGIDVYLWQEPGAEDLVLRAAKAVPTFKVITAPDGCKDISEAHIQGLDLVSLLENLKAKAVSAEVLKACIANARLGELYQQALPVIEADDPLEMVKGAIRGLGYGGDLKPAVITYVGATSRLLAMRDGAMPVHLLITGASSTGKNYTLGRVLALLPPEAYHIIDAGSPRVLIYNDADLQHRLLIFAEADSLPAGEDNPAASAIRNLLQDHRLHYQVTIRDRESGRYMVHSVEKLGPTVLITTSTRSLGDQLSTRLFTLEIADGAEQIGAALAAQAALETEEISPPDSGLIAYQSYLQLKAPWGVVVPFARKIADAMGKMAVAPRILRDFARLLSLVKAVAILRHHKRQSDRKGRIVATLEDYETVRQLVADMYIETTSGAVVAVRELVDAIRQLDASRSEGERITAVKLAAHLNIHKSTAVRRANKAVRQGWIVNREQRRGRPADYGMGDPMLEAEGLPALDELTGCTVAAVTSGIQPISEAKTGNGCMVAVVPDSNTPLPTPDDDLPPYPTHPCRNCGSGDYWLREASQWGKSEWLCSRCHPKPGGGE